MPFLANNPFWQMIDGVVVINLDSRPDRWTQFQAAARDLIPAEKMHRLSARWGRDIPGFGQRPWFRGGKRDGTWAGRAGVTQSHRHAMLRAREAGWSTVLVLEDDVAFASESSSLAASLTTALKECDWQVCYLGFTDPWWPRRREASLGPSHALYRVHGCNTAHAYLVRETARDWILGELPDEANVWPWLARHRAIDRWYQRHLGLKFPVTCVSPSLINQVEGFSDIVEQRTRYSSGPEHEREVQSASGQVGYRLGHALRCLSVRVGLAGDALRGVTRRMTGL